MEKPAVLISTDDDILPGFLEYFLRAENYDVLLASGLEETLLGATENMTRLVLLDCRSRPGMGIQLCARLRLNDGATPVAVIALTGSNPDATECLRAAGADECIAGPVVPVQLMRRIRALAGGAGGDTILLEHAGIEMDMAAYRVQRDGEPVELGPTEFRLLRIMLEWPGKIFSRNELVAKAWLNNVHLGSRTVDVHIGRLRKALTARSASGDPIRTVRSVGYGLADDTDET